MSDSAALTTLRAIAAGEREFARGSSFEPLLVPLVAPYATGDQVAEACSLGRAIARTDPQRGWPLFGLAVARALEPHITTDNAAVSIATLPDLVLFVDTDLVSVSPEFTSARVLARWQYRQGEANALLRPDAHQPTSPDPGALVLGLERMSTAERDAAIPALRAAIAAEPDTQMLVDTLVAPYSSQFATIAREGLQRLAPRHPGWYWTTLAAHLAVYVRNDSDRISAQGRIPKPWADHFDSLLTAGQETDVDEVPMRAHPFGDQFVDLLAQLAPAEISAAVGEVLNGVAEHWEHDVTGDVSPSTVTIGGQVTIAPTGPVGDSLSSERVPSDVSEPSRGRWWNLRDLFPRYRRLGGPDGDAAEPRDLEPRDLTPSFPDEFESIPFEDTLTHAEPPEAGAEFPDEVGAEPPDEVGAEPPDEVGAEPPGEIGAEPPVGVEPSAPPLPRAIQADVAVKADARGPEASVSTSFARGRAHRVRVWIGDDSTRLPTTVTATQGFAEMAVVHDRAEADLDVTLAHGRDTTTRRIHLPRDQAKPSDAADFELFVADDEQMVVATLTIEQNTRVLQQALLIGVSSAEPDGDTDTKIELQVQMSARPVDAATSEMHFDATLTTPDRAGAPSILKAGDVASVPQPWDDALREEIDLIGARLFATASGQATGGADDRAWPKLVRFLALHGKQLYTWLIDHGYASLSQATTIQLTDADPNQPLPIELVYDGAGPALDAELCDGWDAALTSGRCPSCDPAASDAKAICPLHFWGLSKVIERQSGHASVVASEVMPLGGVLFAASANVRAEDIDGTVAALTEACGVAPLTPDSWEEEIALVRTRRPSLLVLFPHQARDSENGIDLLELGVDSALPAGQVSEQHVRAEGAPTPMVLLLGCKTADASVPYLNFVAEFRSKGAAMVVGTTATVLGRDVAPIAQRIVADLAQAARSGGETARVGRVLLEARRQMIADQNAAAFALVAFGDADLTVKGT